MNLKGSRYNVKFEFSSGDGGLLSDDDFNELERKDIRNCSILNICFEPDELSIDDVKITKIFIHYDGITDSPQDYFGFKFEDDEFQGAPSPIITFELNKEVDPDEFLKSIWTSSICIFPESVRERDGEAFFQQDNDGYTSIIDQDELDEYISQLSGAAIVPPKGISFSDGLEGFYELEIKELIGLTKPSQKKSKKTIKQLLRELKKYNKHDGGPYSIDRTCYFLKKEADRSLKSDREFILAAIKINSWSFPFASKKLRSDREIVLAAAEYPHALDVADEKFKSDRGVILAYLIKSGIALQYADPELQNDRDFLLEVLPCVENDDTFQCLVGDVDSKFKSDREIVMAAVSSRGGTLRFADEELKSDREIVMAAVSSRGAVLEEADEELKSDREIVLAAVKNDGCAIQHACKELKYDLEIIFASFESEPRALKFLHDLEVLKIDEPIMGELRKNFGEKLINDAFTDKGSVNEYGMFERVPGYYKNGQYKYLD